VVPGHSLRPGATGFSSAGWRPPSVDLWPIESSTTGDSTLSGLGVAFLAGLVSFATPCVLPLVPSFLSAVSALEPAQFNSRHATKQMLVSLVPFVFGFTLVFVALGDATASATSLLNRQSLNMVSGFILIVVALALIGLIPTPTSTALPTLLVGARRSGSRVLLGGAFAICSAPCIGPVLATALVLAGSTANISRASLLLTFYSLGIALPLVACALAFARAMNGFRWLRDHHYAIRSISSVLIGGVGVLLFVDRFWWLQVGFNRTLVFLHLAAP